MNHMIATHGLLPRLAATPGKAASAICEPGRTLAAWNSGQTGVT